MTISVMERESHFILPFHRFSLMRSSFIFSNLFFPLLLCSLLRCTPTGITPLSSFPSRTCGVLEMLFYSGFSGLIYVVGACMGGGVRVGRLRCSFRLTRFFCGSLGFSLCCSSGSRWWTPAALQVPSERFFSVRRVRFFLVPLG